MNHGSRRHLITPVMQEKVSDSQMMSLDNLRILWDASGGNKVNISDADGEFLRDVIDNKGGVLIYWNR
jgi:hypothetical protein